MITFKLTLIELHVHRASENDGDELYIKVNGSKIWPHDSDFFKMGKLEKVKLNHHFVLEGLADKIDLELWEYDNVILKECLGYFRLHANEVGGPFTTDLQSSTKARYSLTWTLEKSYKKVMILRD